MAHADTLCGAIYDVINTISIKIKEFGEGVKELLDEIVKRVEPPKIVENTPLKALIFDSYFDPYKGVVLLVKIVEGKLCVKDNIKLMAMGSTFEVTELGVNRIKSIPLKELTCGMSVVIVTFDDVRLSI